MSMKVIIAGAGRAGSKLHLNAYQQLPGIEVIALCDLDLDRAKVIARQKGVSYTYSSLDEALNARSADIVSICTPPSSHYELCRIALEHGCHVLVEKPIFQTLEEAEEIQGIIGRTGCKFSAVHNLKYQHSIQQATKLVKERVIGDILQIHAVRMIDGNTDRFAAAPNSWCHDLPGGRWEELIAHPIYKAYQFMGPMRFVHLEMKQVHNRWPWLPADELEIILEGKTGYVSIALSANAVNYNFIVVYGSKRYLYVDSKMAIDLLSIVDRVDSKLSPRKWFRNKLLPTPGSRLKSLNKNPHAALIQDFLAYVHGDCAEPPVDWHEAINTLEIGLQIGREIQQRKSKSAKSKGGLNEIVENC